MHVAFPERARERISAAFETGKTANEPVATDLTAVKVETGGVTVDVEVSYTVDVAGVVVS